MAYNLPAYVDPTLDPLGFYRYHTSQGLVLQVLGNDNLSNPMEAECVRRWRHRGNAGYVSPLYHCQTDKVTDLCFYDITYKLKNNGNYDVGGSYCGDQPDFWFYYTTSMCHGFNFLLNLFVLPRKPSCFTLTLPKNSQLSSQIKTNDVKLAITYGPEALLTFRTTQHDEHVFVKTFLFDAEDINTLEHCMLLVPLSIQVHAKIQMNQNTLRTIKLRHDLSSLFANKESADFTLQSHSSKRYPVHKVLLAAHSSVLRSMMKKRERTLRLEISDEAMELIIEFLYTGTIKNLISQDFMLLLGIAKQFEFTQLFYLAEQVLGELINVQNAISIAQMAKKYELSKLMFKVFEFIKNYPEVLSTEAWYDLEDLILIKQLLRYIHPQCHSE